MKYEKAIKKIQSEGCDSVPHAHKIMCLGAMLQARIQRLVFGAYDAKTGAVTSLFQILQEPKLNHKIKHTGGILADECGKLLSEFFKSRR